VQLGPVDDPRDHLAHVIGRAHVVRDDPVQIVASKRGGRGSARSMSTS
jgi:hypothetical protein